MVATLVIVPCGKAKVWDRNPRAGPTRARDVYTGAPFVVNRKYAERFGDAWLILSAKYGLLSPADVIEGPYNVSFKQRSTRPVGVATLREQVRNKALGRFDRVIGLGGKEYRAIGQDAFAPAGITVEFPFAGLPLGLGMSAVKHATDLGRLEHDG